MRLKLVWISHYKNLKEFRLPFDGNSFIDVFVGKNGTGKSNFFEALVEIFRHLYEDSAISFEYFIQYEIDGQVVDIEWKNSKRLINGKEQKTLGKTPLPDNVLIYYSGHNDTIAELVERYEDAFSSRLRTAGVGNSRRFFGIGPEYKELLLSVLLMQPENNKARQFICHKLGIQEIGADATLLLQRPDFADKKLEIDNFVSETHYWGAEGIVRDFLDKLLTCIKGDFTHGSIYFKEADIYQLPINVELFNKKFEGEKPTDVFRQLDNLKLLNMLAGISIPLTLKDGTSATSTHFSDGQFQSVYIYSIIELFKDRNCITLLDEPDAFLHPEWQFDFLKQVFEITDTAANNNHVLMSSHSASTITTAKESVINLFEFDGSNVVVTKVNKADVIKSLSAGLISFSESEARLNIHHVLKNTTGAILFTEGITDEMILETAWEKLYPAETRKFEIENAFSCGFLRNLMKDKEIYRNDPRRKFFSIFDFDEAFNDWNQLGQDIQVDPCRCLVKKHRTYESYSLLLPVPANPIIRKQVINPISGGNYGNRSLLTIEHLFYGIAGLDAYFDVDTERTDGFIKFISDAQKVPFARDIVPTLDAAHFDVFKPIFEFIIPKC